MTAGPHRRVVVWSTGGVGSNAIQRSRARRRCLRDYERLLEAGINVVTTTSTELVFPPSADAALRERLDAAAQRGAASLHASGIFPGFASDELALLLTTMSRSIRTIRLVEVSLNDHYLSEEGLFRRPS